MNLRKCYENLYKIEIGPDKFSIVSMISAEGEKMAFTRVGLIVRGNLENWFDNVLQAMFETVKKHLKMGY